MEVHSSGGDRGGWSGQWLVEISVVEETNTVIHCRSITSTVVEVILVEVNVVEVTVVEETRTNSGRGNTGGGESGVGDSGGGDRG